MRVLIFVVGGLLLAPVLIGTEASAQTPSTQAKPHVATTARSGPEPSRPSHRDDGAAMKQRLNAWTLGLAAGQLEGAPLRFATELARVVDDGDNLRVVPIVTRGIFDNIYDLLYLRGVDAAIVYGDILDHFKNDVRIAGLERRVNYIMPLFPTELHVFVRPEIKKLEDLAGKPVNFNTKGTAAAYSGPIIFDRLGIKVDARFIPHPVAIGEMATSDKYAAVVFVSSKPLDAFVKRKWAEGFKFLSVPLTPKLEEYYLPAQLEPSDYPGLIPEGQKIQTIAVPSVLAVFNWPQDHDRQKRVARFVDYLFERFPKLQTEAGYHPKWRELNLAATVPGWQRYAPMQNKLNALVTARTAPDIRTGLTEHLERILPGDAAAQERLLRDILEQRKSQSKQ
jgi:TRAP-type uncharacterized transport system substrate-binding protein